MTRRLLLFVALVVGLVASIGTLPAAAQDDDETPDPAFVGVLTIGGDPVAGVTIVATEVDGDFEASTVSEVDGTWRIDVAPRRASYTVAVDASTLPEEVEVDGDTLVLTSSISRAGQERSLIFRLEEGETLGTSDWEQFLQAVVNGLKFGLIIAMCSVGLSLIFGTTGLINFAHGELVTFGAAMAWWLNVDQFEFGLVFAAVLAALATGLLGLGIETGLMAPLRRRNLGSFQFVVVTIGLSLIGRQLIQMWVGEGNRTYRQYQIQDPWQLGPFDLTPRDAAIMGISALVLVLVATALQRTRLGIATRAVADNSDLAASTGIAVDRVIRLVWSLGAALAGLGGVFFGLSEVVKFDMGFRLLLLMFAAVVLGGLGTAYGAMVGGIVIGLVTEISTVWFQPELKFVWALLVLIIVLLFRPQGILGSKDRVG